MNSHDYFIFFKVEIENKKNIYVRVAMEKE
jgi:hypothetical protein